jgi:hypothetical protein
MAGKYEAEGTGLHDWVTRKNVYTGVIVLGAVIAAVLITLGIVTIDDIKTFIELTVYLVGILGGVAAMIAAAIAKNNVVPPAVDPNLRAGDDGTHADYLN